MNCLLKKPNKRYILESSLEQMALVKIASTLWNQSDIKALIKENFHKIYAFWEKIEEEVKKKVEKLLLPNPFKENIASYITLMGFSILKWIRCHSNLVHSEKHYILPIYFLWTSHGTIDKRETGRLLIQDQTVHPIVRYHLAFMYCLEGEIPISSIPEDCKGLASRRADNSMVINEQNLVAVWSKDNRYCCDWHFPETESGTYEASFKNAVLRSNKVAVEYFLQKLTPEEKEACIEKARQTMTSSELLCFFLSQIDEKQQKRILQSWRFMWFLSWPWYSFFVQTANLYWDIENIDRIVPLIFFLRRLNRDNNLVEADIYRNVFGQLWKCAYNRFGADLCSDRFLKQDLSDLFKKEDIQNLRMIFGDDFPALKKRFFMG